jgi:acetyltransferase-like isoleucine patch superfamily enzyme
MGRKNTPIITQKHRKMGKGELKASNDCYIGQSVRIDLTGNVTIDEYADVSSETVIYTHKHKWGHSKGRRREIQKVIPVDLHIHRDSFIGERSLIIGVKDIGEGSIVGAGSVLTKSVPPFEIWAGNPAKKVGERKDE